MLDAQASRQAKEAGMQLALDYSADWKDRVLLELRGWLAIHKARGNSTCTMEQFRAEAKEHPKSFKAWGALPRLACKEGLIAPALHPDGSPVMRAAESVKTHGHLVRVWRLASSVFAPATAAPSPTSHHEGAAVPVHTQSGIARVGRDLVAEVRAMHAGRADMDQAMGEGG